MREMIACTILLLALSACQTQAPIKQADISVGIEDPDTDTLEDGTRYLIHPDKLMDGGPPKDGIPSIDNPKFVSMEDARSWIQDDELVLAIEYKGIKRAYPLQIMVWHEIVNDFIADDPVLITYCPLCGSGIAYLRTVDGKEAEFGTTGQLYNSNLVMYDRLTDTYWTQIDGKAIIGPLTGMELEEISIDTVVWRDYSKVHDDAMVLSWDTGYERNYGTDPYGSYYENSFLVFPVDDTDDSVHPKTVVFGIEVENIYKAYREEGVIEAGKIEDTIGNTTILITRDEAGIVEITDLDSGEEIVKERDFWFAWYAFHPDTLLYEPNG